MEKKLGVKKEMDQNKNLKSLKIKVFKKMTLVTSKNHRNEILKKFN